MYTTLGGPPIKSFGGRLGKRDTTRRKVKGIRLSITVTLHALYYTTSRRRSMPLPYTITAIYISAYLPTLLVYLPAEVYIVPHDLV